MDNREFARGSGARCRRCGESYLEHGSETRVRHTLSCFFFGHRYRLAGLRDGHEEYVCVRCGHPLLIAAERHNLPASGVFRKRVHWECGVTGHHVHRVAARAGATEYACHCGHSFLRPQERERRIRHPWMCVFAGHFVRLVSRRFGYSEFVCRNCGHPFLFQL